MPDEAKPSRFPITETRFATPVEDGMPGPGWFSLLVALHRQLHALDQDYVVESVKEHLGVLAISCSFSDDEKTQIGAAMIGAASRASAHVCEQCGSPAKLRLPAYKTLCDIHQ